jgi:predicted Fe-S protein YdhL (DUF1289 family)
MSELRPVSPCVKVCVLDAASRCTGCGRTIDEIARWPQMSAAEQWAIVRRLQRERLEREDAARDGTGPEAVRRRRTGIE